MDLTSSRVVATQQRVSLSTRLPRGGRAVAAAVGTAMATTLAATARAAMATATSPGRDVPGDGGTCGRPAVYMRAAGSGTCFIWIRERGHSPRVCPPANLLAAALWARQRPYAAPDDHLARLSEQDRALK